MDINVAQSDMRRAYMSGAPGVLASSLAWFAATFAIWRVSPDYAVWVLFIGGMLIFPVGLLIGKLLGASGSFEKGNPLGPLATASTFWMIFCLPLAYAASLLRIEYFFPAMLLIIGGRYLTFGALYGMRAFWFLGLTLAGVGVVFGWLAVAPLFAAAAGASIELIFALIAFVLHARWRKTA